MSERQKMLAFLEANEIPQSQIAKLANTTPATISRVLRGRRGGKAHTARELARVFGSLGCDVDAGKILLEVS